MGRIRTIKPEFWEDDRVGQLSPLARLVFIGSWNLADDAGRLRWSADYINASLFMYDRFTTKKVAALMDEVENQGLIVPYEARGQQLAYVPGWAHQRIDKPQPPRFAPPPGCDSGNGSWNETENDAENPPRQERKGKEGKGTGKGMEAGGTLAIPEDFDRFWWTYPRREAKGEALKAWGNAVKAAPAETIIAGAKRYADDPNRDPAFTAHPATWLNHQRWLDEPQPPRLSGNQGALLRAQARGR